MVDQYSPLQSICYQRGSLRLLDQRKLPLETVYLDILNASDGWNAIRDMVVRGAPAIAISAALSLAVEIFNLDFSGTSLDAASFLVKKLEYLVSSRPTAVNLSDAATKLQNLVLKTAETAADAKFVIQTYIDAAENMLTDDVNTNKAIGFHGANDIQSNLNDSKRISILTHCNTGSLATAGYGTALGVIRALHANGTLETAFCTETRPFNQGSRLTAFELVHDKIPATLIADSAAASLMKAGRVGAVIVGADRIAANGDTANKIGTYSLALCALHHGLPFYVAAPVTSIDLSLSSGDQILIEERSPKELLCSDGGLGKQVAASGIGVWNPAFDVTPANLITAIITEKGVIRKVLADDFNIKGFIQNAANGKKE
ncbi:methylthioribose-1-phosphate isomerase [Dendrobium catenatum]|uniref:Methylthioribose-1-phosphate isomerase n=2 Tax=Dendrobium TaxID=37818 RepID=A0A2I0X512_9ASPA|nr:methylthioribose-1-phosphate isomerase [Dendrobium catenatum]AQX44106.1 methylthioribose-1-phosphate isomerase [Dendrobium officinale]PKU82995.1 Methylthioribose-1-phosphate isomerase [Dendrobium catenatum]